MSRNLPQAKFFAALGTFREYPSASQEWTLDEKLAEAKRQGFEAVSGRIDPALPELCAKHGLEFVLTIDADGSNYREQLERARSMNPRRVNVQMCDHDTPPEESVRVWKALVTRAEALGLEVDLELHRDTATEVPEKAYAIADAYRRETGRTLRFCLDYSHFAVVKQMRPPYAARLLERPDLIAPARQIHARPFNNSHAQIPATDGQGNLTPEFVPWLEFMAELIGRMLTTAGPGDVFYICPEFLAPAGGYGLSCFPDCWKDAVRTRDEIRRIWKHCAGEQVPGL